MSPITTPEISPRATRDTHAVELANYQRKMMSIDSINNDNMIITMIMMYMSKITD